MMTNIIASSVARYDTVVGVFYNLQIAVPTVVACQGVFMPELSDFGSAADAKEKPGRN